MTQQLTQEQQDFLRQRVPPDYADLQQPVRLLRDWLAMPKIRTTAPDPEAARLEMMGLVEPSTDSTIEELRHTVQRCIEAIQHNQDNDIAFYYLAKAVFELARFDEATFHPVPLRDAADLAERARRMAPRAVKAWELSIECQIRLQRFERSSQLLAEMGARQFAPGTHALLSAKQAEAQGLTGEAIAWYERAIGYAASPDKRAHLRNSIALGFLQLGAVDEVDLNFFLALKEGPFAWIAHNWSMHKYQCNKLPVCCELNRRAMLFDPHFEPAQTFHGFLTDVLFQRSQVFPEPDLLPEERTRMQALPGADEYQLGMAEIAPWQPPPANTRARATRMFMRPPTSEVPQPPENTP